MPENDYTLAVIAAGALALLFMFALLAIVTALA